MSLHVHCVEYNVHYLACGHFQARIKQCHYHERMRNDLTRTRTESGCGKIIIRMEVARFCARCRIENPKSEMFENCLDIMMSPNMINHGDQHEEALEDLWSPLNDTKSSRRRIGLAALQNLSTQFQQDLLLYPVSSKTLLESSRTNASSTDENLPNFENLASFSNLRPEEILFDPDWETRANIIMLASSFRERTTITRRKLAGGQHRRSNAVDLESKYSSKRPANLQTEQLPARVGTAEAVRFVSAKAKLISGITLTTAVEESRTE